MDWNSEDGRALLWKAYPSGYLARRGVLTVGGWQCVEGEEGEDGEEGEEGEDGDTSGWWRPIPDNDGLTELGLLRDLPDARVNAGDLLPLPDPTDTATWACLLQDLVESHDLFWRRKPWTGFIWEYRKDGLFINKMSTWRLTVCGVGGRTFTTFLLPPEVVNPAEALIQARASLR